VKLYMDENGVNQDLAKHRQLRGTALGYYLRGCIGTVECGIGSSADCKGNANSVPPN
jgi:hypothetical protein